MHHDLTKIKERHPNYHMLGFNRDVIELSPISGSEVFHDVLRGKSRTGMKERWHIDYDTDLELTVFVYEDGEIKVPEIFKHKADPYVIQHRIGRLIDNLELLKQIIEEEIGDARD